MRYARAKLTASGRRAAVSLLLLTALACGGSSSKPAPSIPGRALAGTANASATAVAPTSDGGFVLAGTTSAGPHGGTDLLLVRIDATGTVLWTQTYGGAGNESGTSVQQTQDGGFVAAGLTDDAGLGGGPGGVYVVRADATGQLSWQRTYAGVIAALHGRTVAVRQTRDGGFVVAGTGPGTELMNPEPDAYLVKTDASGNITWQRTFGEVAAGAQLLYEDSAGNLALAVANGNAAARLGLASGDQVRIRQR